MTLDSSLGDPAFLTMKYVAFHHYPIQHSYKQVMVLSKAHEPQLDLFVITLHVLLQYFYIVFQMRSLHLI